MSNSYDKIKILIPAYKAESELRDFLPVLLKKVSSDRILVVIDGIFDGTQKLCEQFNIKTLAFEENRGKGAALISGFQAISPDTEWVITMDADGQHSPDDLENFLKAIRSADSKTGLILGKRTRSLKLMPLSRIFSNWATSTFVSHITKQQVADSQCGYRAYRLSAVLTIRCKFLRFEMESECILRMKNAQFTVKNVPIKTLYTAQTSHISHFTDTFRWLKAMIITMKEIRKDISYDVST